MHCGNIVLAHSSSSSCSRPAVRRYNLRPRETNSAIKGVASCTYNLRPRPAKSAIKMSGDRAHWPSENVKMLLDICLAEKEKCNMTSMGLLTPAGWKNVEAAVKEIGYTKRQAQNKLQSLKDKFDGWKSLQKSTGLGHNPQTGAVVAEDDWFASQEADTDGTQLDTQPQESGQRRKSRGTPPPFLDELFAMWGSQSKNRGTFMGAGGIDDPTLTPPRMSPELHGTSSVGTSSKRSERDQDVTSPAKKKPSNLTEFMQTISDSIHERSSRSQRRHRERDEQEEVVRCYVKTVLKRGQICTSWLWTCSGIRHVVNNTSLHENLPIASSTSSGPGTRTTALATTRNHSCLQHLVSSCRFNSKPFVCLQNSTFVYH